MRAIVCLFLLAMPVLADDWTGKSIQVKEAVKLGRKVGEGLVREGAELDPKKTYAVKSDTGTLLELADGWIFKFEATVAADAKPLPKEKAKETDPVKAKGEWFGRKVLPRRDPKTIVMGDWVDGKQETWTPHNLLNCTVREDRDGWLRLYDGRREGWVSKADMVTAEDAPAWWDKAVKLTPNDAFVWHMRGLGWLDKGEYDNAIKDLTEAIRLGPDGSSAYISRGRAWNAKKEYDKAIADLTEAIRLDPKDNYNYAFNNRGVSWFCKKEYDKAIADFTEAIRLDPKHATAFSNRGETWHEKKEYNKAIADFDAALKLDPKYAYALGKRAKSYAKLKKYDEAVAGLERSLDLNLEDEIYRDYAKFRASCPDAKYRDGKKAVELAKKAVEKAGKDADWEYIDALAMAYAEAGDFELAVAEQRKAVEMLKAEKFADKDNIKRSEARLQLYRDKKPYRDE